MAAVRQRTVTHHPGHEETYYRATLFRTADKETNHRFPQKLTTTVILDYSFPPMPCVGSVLRREGLATRVSRTGFAAYANSFRVQLFLYAGGGASQHFCLPAKE